MNKAFEGSKMKRRVSLYLPTNLIVRLQARARAEDRSFNNYCLHVLSKTGAPG